MDHSFFLSGIYIWRGTLGGWKKCQPIYLRKTFEKGGREKEDNAKKRKRGERRRENGNKKGKIKQNREE